MINKNKNYSRARIGWGGLPPSRSIIHAMDAAAYEIIDMEEASHSSPPDIFIIDVRSAQNPVAIARERLNQSRRHAPMSGAILYASRNENAPNRKALGSIGETVFEDEKHSSLILAIRDRLRLGSLAEETAERIRSLTGKPSPAVLAAANALKKKGFLTPCVFSAGHAMRTLEAEAIDSAIFLPEDENDVLISLARALKRHRSFRKTPVLVVGNKKDVTRDWFDGESFDLIYTDHLDTNLTNRIERATRRARLSSVMANFLGACDGVNIRDKTSGAYTSGFFTEHGARLHRRAKEIKHPLSIVGIEFTGCKSAEIENRLAREATKIIMRITRAQDMPVRLTSTQLAVLLPAVTPSDASEIAERILGVLTASLRHSGGIFCGYCGARDSLEETIAALIVKLKQAENIGLVNI